MIFWPALLFQLVMLLLMAVCFAKLVAFFTVRALRKEKLKELASRTPQPPPSKAIDLNRLRDRSL